MKADDALQAEDLARVLKAVEQMPERTRQVITLRKVYGFSQHEIAFRLDMTEQEVEDEIKHAVRFMAEKEIPDGH